MAPGAADGHSGLQRPVRGARAFCTARARSVSLALCGAMLLSLASCIIPLDMSAYQGSLVVSVVDARPMTITPNVDLMPTQFDFTATGPDGTVVTDTTDGTELTLTGLAFGTWTVAATAFNSAGTAIAAGEATVEVHTAETAVATLGLTPLSGTGGLAIGVSWPEQYVAMPETQVTLKASDGTTTPVAMDHSIDGTATAALANVADGYYVLSVQLLDGSQTVAGFTEVVRVVSGETTTVDHTFQSVNRITQEVVVTQTSFALAWDPPTTGQVDWYRVYYRSTDGTAGSESWQLLGTASATSTPNFTIDGTLLSYGAYEFAVSAVDGTVESELHTSTDTAAMPETGWYVNWTGPA